MKFELDFTKSCGKIKPLHGVNNSPKVLNGTIPSFTDAGIPYARLHDAIFAYGGTHYVDIPNVFPNFDADENLPESYDFAFTDAYLASIVASGTKVFYRLGVTIENDYQIKAYNINPPKDYAKWARICEHVIRHYNEGWADGYHYGIEYWEIWNEPENPPMWTGTPEQYYELYSVAANYLKKCFPNLKFGGYASCGFYYISGIEIEGWITTKILVDYFEGFLKYITDEKTKAPLDFFSWHIYTMNPNLISDWAKFVREKLDSYGFTMAEHFLDEWNLEGGKFDEMKSEIGASFVAQTMNIMQASSLDKAMYYDACPTRSYCGIYAFPGTKLTKTYYSFYAFNKLYRLGNCAGVKVYADENVSVSGAFDGNERAILIANYSGEEKTVSISLCGVESDTVFECCVTDGNNMYEKAADVKASELSEFKLTSYSVVLLTGTKE